MRFAIFLFGPFRSHSSANKSVYIRCFFDLQKQDVKMSFKQLFDNPKSLQLMIIFLNQNKNLKQKKAQRYHNP